MEAIWKSMHTDQEPTIFFRVQNLRTLYNQTIYVYHFWNLVFYVMMIYLHARTITPCYILFISKTIFVSFDGFRLSFINRCLFKLCWSFPNSDIILLNLYLYTTVRYSVHSFANLTLILQHHYTVEFTLVNVLVDFCIYGNENELTHHG